MESSSLQGTSVPHQSAAIRNKKDDLYDQLSSHLSSLNSELIRLQLEYDWDDYLFPLLKKMHIQVKILDGRLKKSLLKNK